MPELYATMVILGLLAVLGWWAYWRLAKAISETMSVPRIGGKNDA